MEEVVVKLSEGAEYVAQVESGYLVLRRKWPSKLGKPKRLSAMDLRAVCQLLVGADENLSSAISALIPGAPAAE